MHSDPQGTAEPHDHGSCVAQALQSAEGLCARSGKRLTALRRAVLREIWRSHDAVKAYDILARIGAPGRSAQPPTVYRALRFLQEQGLVHRLESLNAFVGCPAPGRQHRGQFLICECCGRVEEFHAAPIGEALARTAAQRGFTVERQVVEVSGRCRQCK